VGRELHVVAALEQDLGLLQQALLHLPLVLRRVLGRLEVDADDHADAHADRNPLQVRFGAVEAGLEHGAQMLVPLVPELIDQIQGPVGPVAILHVAGHLDLALLGMRDDLADRVLAADRVHPFAPLERARRVGAGLEGDRGASIPCRDARGGLHHLAVDLERSVDLRLLLDVLLEEVEGVASTPRSS
jgi:hypothetical protein